MGLPHGSVPHDTIPAWKPSTKSGPPGKCNAVDVKDKRKEFGFTWITLNRKEFHLKASWGIKVRNYLYKRLSNRHASLHKHFSRSPNRRETFSRSLQRCKFASRLSVELSWYLNLMRAVPSLHNKNSSIKTIARLLLNCIIYQRAQHVLPL